MRARIRAWIVGGSIVCAGVASAQPQGAAPAAPAASAAPAPSPEPPASPAPSTFTLRRKLALAAGVVGVAAIGVGIGRGLQAASREDDAYALCASPFTPCPDAPAANHLLERAESRALQANIAFGVAGVAALGAAVLWFTGAPERRVAVSPRVGSLTGLDLAVRF
jgi:hypothetical protein